MAYIENLLNFDQEDGKTVLGPAAVGSIKWISHPNGPPITQTAQVLMQTIGLSVPIRKLPWLRP